MANSISFLWYDVTLIALNLLFIHTVNSFVSLGISPSSLEQLNYCCNGGISCESKVQRGSMTGLSDLEMSRTQQCVMYPGKVGFYRVLLTYLTCWKQWLILCHERQVAVCQ
jgi:hypothetical protein